MPPWAERPPRRRPIPLRVAARGPVRIFWVAGGRRPESPRRTARMGSVPASVIGAPQPPAPLETLRPRP